MCPVRFVQGEEAYCNLASLCERKIYIVQASVLAVLAVLTYARAVVGDTAI